jgi:ABC-2 type transport system permease protein
MVAAQVRSQTQYRTSFAIDVAGSVLFAVLDIGSVLVLFRLAPTLGSFGFPEVFLMAALAVTAFAAADVAVGNVERLRVYVRSGLLDAVLVRPLGVLVQLTALDVAPRRIGRLGMGIVMLLLAAAHAHVPLTPHSLALLALTPIAGAVIFGAVFVATATVAFWWIDSGEIANGFTYGGLHFTQYPITIYGPALRRIFAYAVGFAFVAYYPTLALLDRSDPLGGPVVLLAYGAPVVAVVAAAVAALIWRTGVRHYRSTGS